MLTFNKIRPASLPLPLERTVIKELSFVFSLSNYMHSKHQPELPNWGRGGGEIVSGPEGSRGLITAIASKSLGPHKVNQH